MSSFKLKLAVENVRNLLDSGQELTYRQLSEKTTYSERHVKRAIDALRSEGVSVQSRGRPLRFSIPEQFRRNACRTIDLTDEEILALKLAAQISHSALEPTPLCGALDTALKRLLESLAAGSISFDSEAQTRRWYFGDAPSSRLDPVIFNTIREAAIDNRSVRIDYYAARSEKEYTDRKIDPYCVTMRGGTWVVIAHCHLRNDLREFNLVDIRRAVLCDPGTETHAYFTIPDTFDPDLYFRDRFRHLGDGVVHEVRLLVEGHHASYFRRKNYHPTQQIEELGDGRIEVSFEVEGLDEVRSFAQSWGVGVTVLAPDELVALMRTQALELARRYDVG